MARRLAALSDAALGHHATQGQAIRFAMHRALPGASPRKNRRAAENFVGWARHILARRCLLVAKM
jgi:hypothetical protein